MSKEQVNELLKNRIGFSKDEEIDELRKEYNKIIEVRTEKDFYYSVLCWWNDGNAPYYNNYLLKEWL